MQERTSQMKLSSLHKLFSDATRVVNWFENTRLPFVTASRFFHSWAKEPASVECWKNFGMNHSTLVDWDYYFLFLGAIRVFWPPENFDQYREQKEYCRTCDSFSDSNCIGFISFTLHCHRACNRINRLSVAEPRLSCCTSKLHKKQKERIFPVMYLLSCYGIDLILVGIPAEDIELWLR
ncbi:hypothetical protein KIN20_025974 [Parelaphostrongylus tenuis]|uniref:Uncharacterized protein n=1 Tax=Parelaphostrongylus tenuis TaxID=148309 RepID=A0AAD5MW24_PARTN|nr:hypothetical protein KIN20_025974 [Parelaphostrongylus tenuis]